MPPGVNGDAGRPVSPLDDGPMSLRPATNKIVLNLPYIKM